MIRYENLSGRSNVIAYEYGDEFIRVQFGDNSVYLYTYQSAGSANIDHMKKLAEAGSGLSSFIMRNAKKSYARSSR